MSSAKTARATVEEIRFPNRSNEHPPAFRRTHPSNVVVFPGGKANVVKRTVSPAAPWTTTVRMDPTRKLIHDFRNTVQELVYAVERADREAVAGLAESLDGYLLEALYGADRVA